MHVIYISYAYHREFYVALFVSLSIRSILLYKTTVGASSRFPNSVLLGWVAAQNAEEDENPFDADSSMSKRIYVAFIVLFASALFTLIGYWALHTRLYAFRDVVSIVQTATLRPLNARCKQYNSSHCQCLPNTFIVGASKAGTTSLVHFLSQTEHVHFVKRKLSNTDKHKEVHRFDRSSYGWSLKGLELAHEWAASPLVRSERDLVVHYTPQYIYAPTVPFDLRSFLPNASDAKFIILLREPVERAESSYWFKNSHLFGGKDKGSVQNMVKAFHQELKQRRVYEDCMTEQWAPLLPPSALLPLPAPLSTLTMSEHSSPRYLSILHYLLGQFTLLNSLSVNVTVYEDKSVVYCILAPPSLSLQAQPPRSYPLSFLRETLYSSLETCFGPTLRSKELGLRHIDKGVYVDQLLRYVANFPASFTSSSENNDENLPYFILSSSFLKKDAKGAVELLLKKMQTQEPLQLQRVNFKENKLSKPNALAQALPREEREVLSEFYKPYDILLQSLLSPLT